MKRLYLILAILGAVLPYLFFFQFFAAEGVSLPGFLSGLFANGAAGGFTVDLLITSFIFWIYNFTQHRDNQAPSPYLFVVLNLLIGLSCAFPAYLYARERS